MKNEPQDKITAHFKELVDKNNLIFQLQASTLL
jgi:hypothetical protein